MASRVSVIMALCVLGFCFGALALTGQGDSPSGALDTTPPVFAGVTATPTQASLGDTVTLTFTASKALYTEPGVLVNGNVAVITGVAGTAYTCTYVVVASDAPGMASISIAGEDLLGNADSLLNDTALEIVSGDALMSLGWWPWTGAALFLVMACFAYRRLRNVEAPSRRFTNAAKMPRLLCLLLIATLFCLGAVAQGPEVSNVSFVQQRADAGGTEVVITYDLLAPNGPCDITVLLSKDGGAAFAHPVTSVTGAVAGVLSGGAHTITWDIASDYPHAFTPDAALRLIADDGVTGHQVLLQTEGTPGASLDGDVSQTVAQGGNATIVTALEPASHHFVRWTLGGVEYATTPAITVTNVTGAMTLVAEYAINQYVVTFQTDGTPGAMLDGATAQTIAHGGSAAEVTAQELASHQFVRWTLGGAEYATTPVLTVTNVTEAMTLTAEYAVKTYTLTYTAGANGSISGPTPQTVNHGDSGAQVTAVPTGSYFFSQWSDGVLTAARTDTDVTGDITVTASFVSVNVTSFAINSGAATTTNPVVTLNNTCVGSPTQYMASESSDFSGATWLAYGVSPSFTLSAGEGGTKTVYFKVRNAGGDSAVVSDTIDLVERTITLPNSVPLSLRWIPAGSYQMGRYPGEVDSDTNEDPQHPVTLAYGFWMGKYQVTQQQWLAVRGSWPDAAPSSTYGVGNTYPAYYISWNDAKNFITSLNAHIVSSGQGPLTVRLPSEAEWEYAARAGTTTRFYWGDDIGYTQIGAYAWYNGNNSPNGSKAVGGKLPNAFGLYDMSGNVWEWCEDDGHESYTGAPSDGSAWMDSPRVSSRVVRGGGWFAYAEDCRSAYRDLFMPDFRFNGIGFRLAAVQ